MRIIGLAAGRRRGGNIKREKDVQQAEALLKILSQKRSYELGEIWNEAFQRGETWAEALTEAMTQIEASTRDLTLKVAKKVRSVLPEVDLTFDDRPAVYDLRRDAVVFHGQALGRSVTCQISREALDDNFGTDHADNDGRLQKFREKRTTIEALARTKYLSWPVEEPEVVLIKSTDIPKLLMQ